MHCAGGEEEEAVEATEMPTETRVLWGPVTKQVADAIGVPTAVASVLLRPSSATAEAAARMEALVPYYYRTGVRRHPVPAEGRLPMPPAAFGHRARFEKKSAYRLNSIVN